VKVVYKQDIHISAAAAAFPLLPITSRLVSSKACMSFVQREEKAID
jgi:hypothetical protein